MEWKDVYFRRCSDVDSQGFTFYWCPLCKTKFDHSDIDFLQGDHVWPYSLCGETSWDNYQLVCASCNARKKNFVDNELRSVLGQGQFREMVLDYVAQKIKEKELEHGFGLNDMLERR